MEVHDIADLAGRIDRGLMEQVFKVCRVAIVYVWGRLSSKNTEDFPAAFGALPEDKLYVLDAAFTSAKRLYPKSKNKLTILSCMEQDGLRPDTDLEDNLKLRAQYYKDSAMVLTWTMKNDWHTAESVVKEITQQTASAAVGISDSRISDYLSKKDYENNAWVLATRFWCDQGAAPKQLSIVADIIYNKLYYKLATIDKMDVLALYTQIIPNSVVETMARNGRCV